MPGLIRRVAPGSIGSKALPAPEERKPHARPRCPSRTPSDRLPVLRLLFAAALPSGASAAAGDLYAVTGAGGGTNSCQGALSSLYTLDPDTGAATLVGPITIGGTQVRHVTGLGVNPNDGTLYAIRGSQVPFPD
jgi:hypothetical protein